MREKQTRKMKGREGERRGEERAPWSERVNAEEADNTRGVECEDGHQQQ
jgi:hypothetical protein